jgi:hypothetical protein
MISLTVLLTARLHAESPFVREMTLLQQHRDRDLAAAEDPIRRSYRQGIEELLRRATEAHDLEAVSMLRTELQKLGGGDLPRQATPTQTPSGAEALASRLVGTKWVWFGGETITFLADGKAEWSTGKQIWPWKVTSIGLRVIEGVNMAKGAKFTITFEHDLQTGTIKDYFSTRKTHIVPGP